MAVYQKGIAERHLPGWPVSVNEIQDQVLVPAEAGRSDLVENGLNFARAIAAHWPSGALEQWGRGDDWLEGLAALASRRDELKATVEEEVTAHRLASRPFVPLS